MDTRDKPERSALNRQQRRAAEKLVQTPYYKARAKKIELAVLKAELERQYMAQAIAEVFGDAED